MSNIDQPAAAGFIERGAAILKARPWRHALLAGLGGAITIGALATAHSLHLAALLIPPFGASCVLVFGVPASPFARPRNVVGGHVLSAFMGLLSIAAFGASAWGIGIGVGLAIAVMILTDTVHPPAGANPIVVALAGAGWSFLFAPVLAGALAVVLLGWVYNDLRKRAGV